MDAHVPSASRVHKSTGQLQQPYFHFQSDSVSVPKHHLPCPLDISESEGGCNSVTINSRDTSEKAPTLTSFLASFYSINNEMVTHSGYLNRGQAVLLDVCVPGQNSRW